MAKRRNYGRNRHLDFSSKIGEIEYERAKHTPTDKQKKFKGVIINYCVFCSGNISEHFE